MITSTLLRRQWAQILSFTAGRLGGFAEGLPREPATFGSEPSALRSSSGMMVLHAAEVLAFVDHVHDEEPARIRRHKPATGRWTAASQSAADQAPRAGDCVPFQADCARCSLR